MISSVAVLAGGSSSEREVSQRSGQAVHTALSGLGMSCRLVDPVDGFIDTLKKMPCDIVFIALHGQFGEDGTVQAMLEEAGLCYTGSGVEASARAFDKAKAQGVLKANGLPVPEFVVLHHPSDVKSIPWQVPFVVKPAKGGSSVGVSIVGGASEAERACRLAFEHSDEVLVEEYIRGRELTVGILGDEALPVGEIMVQRSFYDYEAKYGNAGTRYEFPAALPERTAAELRALALKAHRVLGCEIMSRVDFMLSSSGKPFILEVNSIPGLTNKSLLPKAAMAKGIDFPTLCVKILDLSFKRRRSKSWSGR